MEQVTDWLKNNKYKEVACIIYESEDYNTHFTLRYRIGRNRNGMNFFSLDQ